MRYSQATSCQQCILLGDHTALLNHMQQGIHKLQAQTQNMHACHQKTQVDYDKVQFELQLARQASEVDKQESIQLSANLNAIKELVGKYASTERDEGEGDGADSASIIDISSSSLSQAPHLVTASEILRPLLREHRRLHGKLQRLKDENQSLHGALQADDTIAQRRRSRKSKQRLSVIT
jgi:hypothetical protein